MSYTSFAAFVPFEWDKIKNADYYILEFTNDYSFNDILMVYTPKENEMTIEIKSGTYYLKVTAIVNEGKNNQTGLVRVVSVDSKGFVSYDKVKEQYPNTKGSMGDAMPIQITMQRESDIGDLISKSPKTGLSHPLLGKAHKGKVSLHDVNNYLELEKFLDKKTSDETLENTSAKTTPEVSKKDDILDDGLDDDLDDDLNF